MRTRTSKVWLPSASPLIICGEVQAANAAGSTRHSNVALAPALGEENAKVAEVADTDPEREASVFRQTLKHLKWLANKRGLRVIVHRVIVRVR